MVIMNLIRILVFHFTIVFHTSILKYNFIHEDLRRTCYIRLGLHKVLLQINTLIEIRQVYLKFM